VRIDTLHTKQLFLCNRNGNKEKALKQNCIINTTLRIKCTYGHRWFLDISTANIRRKRVHGLKNQQLVCVVKRIIVSLLPCLDETWWYRHRWRSRKGSLVTKILIGGCDEPMPSSIRTCTYEDCWKVQYIKRLFLFPFFAAYPKIARNTWEYITFRLDLKKWQYGDETSVYQATTRM
jgi:hypothetical protein